MAQLDTKVRVVTLDVLMTMARQISGICHTYAIDGYRPGANRVRVIYNNPNEYGTSNPVTAILPCYQGTFATKDNPYVVLDPIRFINDRDGVEWQSFEVLWDCQLAQRPLPGTEVPDNMGIV